MERGKLVAQAEAQCSAGEVKVSELYRGPGEAIYIDFLTPVPSRHGGSARRIAGNSLLIRSEASSFLFAMVQSWPTPSRTAESVLVRREGTTVRYLNELRHRQGAALKLVLPLREDLPAAMAVRGVVGIREGVDYRGVPVLAALRGIPDTQWFLVTKVDREEVYAALRQRAAVLALELALLLVSCLAIFALLWRLHRDRLQKERQQAGALRHHREERRNYVRRHINEIVLLVDEQGRIVEANEQASAAYGYTPEELTHLSIRDLLAESELELISGTLQDLWENGSQTIEGRHRRKDGSSLPVEVSTRRFDEGEEKIRVKHRP